MGEMDVLHAFDVTEVRSQSRKKTEQSKEDLSFSQVLNKKQQRCPYSSRAENGEIHYKGTTFTCDEKTNSICLGDMSNPKDILMIIDAPLFGIWSPAGKHAPFVCIEPWYGRCDRVGFCQELSEREYGNALEASEIFQVYYDIQVI